ncbi:hypothetical protein [Nocardia niwae]|uniref:hypothetical protein n=1 Tax=Nocardia niwae TaxID=626084 RepID=UPI0033EA7C56
MYSEAERVAVVRDAYDRRIAALHAAITAWADKRGIAHGPAAEGDYSVELLAGDGRRVTLRLLPSWEYELPSPNLIVEDEVTAMRMESTGGMPTAAALKGLLTGLLIPHDPNSR